MVGGVLPEQLIAEPQDLPLIGDVAVVAGDALRWRGGRPGPWPRPRRRRRVRSHAATEQPCAASWRTSSRPMPEPPPVTTASFPLKESTLTMVVCYAAARQRAGVPRSAVTVIWPGPRLNMRDLRIHAPGQRARAGDTYRRKRRRTVRPQAPITDRTGRAAAPVLPGERPDRVVSCRPSRELLA